MFPATEYVDGGWDAAKKALHQYKTFKTLE